MVSVGGSAGEVIASHLAGEVVRSIKFAVASQVVSRRFAASPTLSRQLGHAGRERRVNDAEQHLEYLADAVAFAAPELFFDYVAWHKVVLVRRGFGEDELAADLQALRAELRQRLAPADFAPVEAVLEAALAALPELPVRVRNHLAEGPRGAFAQRFLELVLRGERREALTMVIDAATSGVPVRSLYLEVFQPVLREVGRRWQENDLNVAEEHVVTAVVQLAMAHLYPHVFGAPRTGRACVVTCVAGDLHDIGSRMVADFLEMAGWDAIYLGGNTPAPDVLRVVERRSAALLCVSVSLATHLRAATELVAALRRAPLGAEVRVLAGGRPFVVCPRLWRSIGADGSGDDAAAAVAAADELVPPREVARS